MRTLVIGVAGTGKSFLVREMRRRGFNAVDVDQGLATFIDDEGKEVAYNPEGGARWWASHYYILKLEELHNLLRSDSIFLFGDVGGQPRKRNGLLDVAHLFDRICYLKASSELIRQRLAARTDNLFGKNPEEVEGTLKHKAKMDGAARRKGFEIVEAALPTDDIIKIIVGLDY